MKKLFVANLPAEITEEQIREIFKLYGDVTEVQIWSEEHLKDTSEKETFFYATVTMPAEKIATKTMHQLNGFQFDGRRLAISPAEWERIKPLMPKQKQAVEEMAQQMGESETKPLRMLETMVLLCGVSFVQAIFEDAKELEAQGGLMTRKGDRRRTLGGVFFYLARFRMSRAMRMVVYNRKGRLPAEITDETAELVEQN